MCPKQSSNGLSPENFLTIGGYFEHYTYRATALAWLKKKEQEEEEEEDKTRRLTILTFDHFRFTTLKQLLHVVIATADWGKFYKLLYVIFGSHLRANCFSAKLRDLRLLVPNCCYCFAAYARQSVL